MLLKRLLQRVKVALLTVALTISNATSWKKLMPELIWHNSFKRAFKRRVRYLMLQTAHAERVGDGVRFNHLPLSAEKVYLATHEGEELTCKA